MKKRLLTLLVPVVVASLVAGCGDGTMDPEPPDTQGPPDLSGSYTLVSLVGSITGGITLAPPVAEGMFTLTQSSSSGDTGTGSLSVSITVTNPIDGSVFNLEDQGTFTVRADGSWEQTGVQQQALGTYQLAGNLLTVTVTEPATASGTTVWQRQ